MVSNAVKMDQEKVVAVLQRLCAQRGDDPDYQALRKDLPKDWPI
ncbi:MAG TPA: hypothetical protein VK632_04775 [Verrucomicrobiae bacterium]|jgi:hypothetical protein|nr:hypothetical protein [Verrucomicrobiae bacterium]